MPGLNNRLAIDDKAGASLATDTNAINSYITRVFERGRALLAKASDLQRSAILALLVRVAAAGLGFGTQVLIAQLLGAKEYGLYSYFWVWIMIGGFVASLGFSEAATRFIAEYRDTEQYGLGWGFIRYSIALVLLVSGGVAALGFLSITLFSDQLPTGHFVLISLALLCLPLFALQDLLEGSALAFSWTGLAHIPPYILRQGLVAGFLVLLLLLAQPATAVTALVAVLLAVLVATGFQLVIFLRRVRRTMTAAPRQTNRGHWMKTALPMWMANGFQIFLTFSDIIILGMFVDSSAVALYFAATRISSQVTAVQFAVTSSVAQRLASLKATNETDALHLLISSSARWIFWPTLAVTFGILIAGWPLLWLFGSEFTAAYSVLPILALGLLARASTGAAEDALKMVGHERPEFFAKAGSTVLNLGLNFALIPQFGIHGAALATAISVMVYSIVLEVLVRRLIGTSSFILTVQR